MGKQRILLGPKCIIWKQLFYFLICWGNVVVSNFYSKTGFLTLFYAENGYLLSEQHRLLIAVSFFILMLYRIDFLYPFVPWVIFMTTTEYGRVYKHAPNVSSKRLLSLCLLLSVCNSVVSVSSTVSADIHAAWHLACSCFMTTPQVQGSPHPSKTLSNLWCRRRDWFCSDVSTTLRDARFLACSSLCSSAWWEVFYLTVSFTGQALGSEKIDFHLAGFILNIQKIVTTKTKNKNLNKI